MGMALKKSSTKNEIEDIEPEVVITEINNRVVNNTISNIKKSLTDEIKPGTELFLSNKEEDMRYNFNYHANKSKNISHRLTNKFDMYDVDLSFNSSRENLGNCNLDNNLEIQPKKNDDGSEGSSFGSLMDSMKMIEESL